MIRSPTRTPVLAALACTCAVAAPAPAGAQHGGAPAGTSTPAGAAGPFRASPAPGRITCRTGCAGLDAARTGSVVRVVGEGLQTTTGVLFLGAPGARDDVRVPAGTATPSRVEAVVPPGAATGPVALVSDAGVPSRPSRRPLRVGARGARDVQAAVGARRVFFGGRRSATLDVFVPEGAPRAVVVDVVRLADGVPVARLDAGEVAPGSVASVEWRGVAGGRVQPDGRYAFRFAAPGTVSDTPFTFLRHRFPIRGKHHYGSGAARYGAERSGGSHRGEDVFAACGTPLVAARGGRVKFAGFQARAGNYLVIDGAGTGSDHAYMHLRDRVDLERGDAIATGQLIGAVGDTGAADGCHLHFEVWGAPGWFTGGAPVDPLPLLQKWDTQSGVQTPAGVERAVRARAARPAAGG